MPLISCKVELKLKWTEHSVLASAGSENVNANSDIISTIKDTKLYVPVVTLSAKNNQKLYKHCSKGFKRSLHWSEYKTKSETKNLTNEYKYFLEPSFVGVSI